MTFSKKRTTAPSRYLSVTLLLLVALFQGCDGGEHHHNLNLHKPKNLELAIRRLKGIHLVITSNAPLPEPRTFIEDHDHDHAHSHSHSHSHSHADLESVEVSIFQELHDIVRWLPKIAADSDMDEETWNEVNQLQKRLEPLAEEITAAEKSDRRKVYQKNSQMWQETIDLLKKKSQNDKSDHLQKNDKPEEDKE